MGIANNFGVLLNVEHREGLIPVLTEEENEEYASNTITRHKTRKKFAEVKDFDSIIMEKIIPLIKKEKHNFGDSHTIDHE
jgi:hypothetical protein